MPCEPAHRYLENSGGERGVGRSALTYKNQNLFEHKSPDPEGEKLGYGAALLEYTKTEPLIAYSSNSDKSSDSP